MYDFSDNDEVEYVRDRESREYILYGSDIEDYIGFINDQIKNPFDASVGINFLKKIRKLVPDENKMDDICCKILDSIAEAYPNMELDLDQIQSHYYDFTEAVYKFFVKNIRKLVTVYIKSFTLSPKNRKELTEDYNDSRLANYPKEQFGNKENYVMITFLKKIVKSFTKEGDYNLTDMIGYIKDADDCPEYVRLVEKYLDNGTIIDYGLYEDVMTYFWKSDARDSMLNKLSLKINDAVVQPLLKEMGYDNFPLTLIAQDDDDDIQEPDEDDPELVDDEDEMEYSEKDVTKE